MTALTDCEFSMPSLFEEAPDNLIDGFDRTTCDDDPPSEASSPLAPGPQRALVRIAIDRGESFFKARTPKQIDTFLNTVVVRERRARGGKRADPLLFLEESALCTRRRRRSTRTTPGSRSRAHQIRQFDDASEFSWPG